MCGICGAVYAAGARPIERRRLEAMNQALIHRGPDDGAIWIHRNAGLAARRLSIRDVERGRQPMTSGNERFAAVFNGEIYNDAELRHDLEQAGARFRTRCDTEVVLRAFETWGDDALGRFNGMFALAVYDQREQRLILARDCVGVKPLFYAQTQDGLVFASELDALLRSGMIDPELDHHALDAYFSLLYIPAPATIYKDIRKLLPGESLVYQNGKLSLRRYWAPQWNIDPSWTLDSAAEAYRALLKDAVQRQRVSDVPLGAFLSGGVDSSAVVALLAELNSNPVKTFSIGFDDANANELPYARAVAERFETRHTEAILQPDLVQLSADLIRHFGEPFGDSSAIPTWLVSKLAREHVTVALSGDGGDELFAGYTWTHMNHSVDQYRRVPHFIRQTAHRLLQNAPDRPLTAKLRAFSADSFLTPAESFERRQTTLTPELKAALYTTDFLGLCHPDGITKSRPLPPEPSLNANEWMLNRDLSRYLPDDVLTKVDRMSMANSLEVRVPILDHRLVEFALTVPFHLKYRHRVSKRLVKRALQRQLPKQILAQRKQGFAIPIHKWFRGPLANHFHDAVLAPGALSIPYLRRESITGLFEHHRAGRGNFGHQLWVILIFELWLRYRRQLNAAIPAPGMVTAV